MEQLDHVNDMDVTMNDVEEASRRYGPKIYQPTNRLVDHTREKKFVYYRLGDKLNDERSCSLSKSRHRSMKFTKS